MSAVSHERSARPRLGRPLLSSSSISSRGRRARASGCVVCRWDGEATLPPRDPVGSTSADSRRPTDTTIVLTRTFEALRRLVWEAMFTPDKMRRWMLPPPGWTLTTCETLDVLLGERG
jgi:hypothetical protein